MTADVRRLPLSDHHDTILANPGLGWSDDTMAEAWANRDARLRRHARPSADEIIEANRPVPQAADDREFWGAMVALWAIVLAAVGVLFLGAVAVNGIARALDRPEACRTLNAVECTAKLQGEPS